MSNPFFERPILNSPYAYPVRHWELDEQRRIRDEINAARALEGYEAGFPARSNGAGGTACLGRHL